MKGNQLPLPGQIRRHRKVAEFECSNRYGVYTTDVYALPGETATQAMRKRREDLVARGNTILKERRMTEEEL